MSIKTKNQKPISEIREEEKVNDKAKIAKLEKENASLKQQLSQVNGDVSAFIDFYFTKFPDQA